ncbi:MAG TPA: archaeosortase/exosortase family protein, partial [Tepidisphaeraceae bacterium]
MTRGGARDRFWGLPLSAWVQIVAITALMIALFRFNLVRLWGKTNPFNGQDSNWQHSIFVPLIGIYYLYIHRDELLRAAAMPQRPERSIRVLSLIGIALMALACVGFLANGETGTPLMLAGLLGLGLAIPAAIPRSGALGAVLLAEGLLVFAYGIWPGQNDYVKDLGMVITVFGVATLLAGWPVMKVAWFPIAFLVVALPWPELVYSRLASPLQRIAASVAVGTLRLSGVTAQNYGTKIMMFGQGGVPRVLNVAEACAGLKSVMTFLMVGGTVAFLSQRPLWEKVIITLSAIPIAIFCNVMRVAGQGVLDFYWSHEVSEGFAHQFVGLIMIIPGFFLILLVGWILDRLFIEELDRDRLALAGNNNRIAGPRTPAPPSSAAPARTNKRVIVEVPRKPPAGESPPTEPAHAAIQVATPGEPVAPANVPAPSAPAPATKPTSTPKPAPPPVSTLKAPPPPAARDRATGGNGGVAIPPSTLK